jgi:predicted nuclease of predicted toxin-antitoxin system
MIELYLDENLSEYVADALNFLNKGYFQNFQVYATKIKIGKGKKDEEIIPVIGNSNGIIITKDLNIHRTRLQYQLCEEYKIGIFFLKFPKGLDKHWEIVKLLINSWEEILSKITKEKRPFGFEVPLRGKMRKL